MNGFGGPGSNQAFRSQVGDVLQGVGRGISESLFRTGIGATSLTGLDTWEDALRRYREIVRKNLEPQTLPGQIARGVSEMGTEVGQFFLPGAALRGAGKLAAGSAALRGGKLASGLQRAATALERPIPQLLADVPIDAAIGAADRETSIAELVRPLSPKLFEGIAESPTKRAAFEAATGLGVGGAVLRAFKGGRAAQAGLGGLAGGAVGAAVAGPSPEEKRAGFLKGAAVGAGGAVGLRAGIRRLASTPSRAKPSFLHSPDPALSMEEAIPPDPRLDTRWNAEAERLRGEGIHVLPKGTRRLYHGIPEQQLDRVSDSGELRSILTGAQKTRGGTQDEVGLIWFTDNYDDARTWAQMELDEVVGPGAVAEVDVPDDLRLMDKYDPLSPEQIKALNENHPRPYDRLKEGDNLSRAFYAYNQAGASQRAVLRKIGLDGYTYGGTVALIADRVPLRKLTRTLGDAVEDIKFVMDADALIPDLQTAARRLRQSRRKLELIEAGKTEGSIPHMRAAISRAENAFKASARQAGLDPKEIEAAFGRDPIGKPLYPVSPKSTPLPEEQFDLGQWWSEETGKPLAEWYDLTPQQRQTEVRALTMQGRHESLIDRYKAMGVMEDPEEYIPGPEEIAREFELPQGAAVRSRYDGQIYRGVNHADAMNKAFDAGDPGTWKDFDEGFWTNQREYISRQEGHALLRAGGKQVGKMAGGAATAEDIIFNARRDAIDAFRAWTVPQSVVATGPRAMSRSLKEASPEMWERVSDEIFNTLESLSEDQGVGWRIAELLNEMTGNTASVQPAIGIGGWQGYTEPNRLLRVNGISPSPEQALPYLRQLAALTGLATGQEAAVVFRYAGEAGRAPFQGTVSGRTVWRRVPDGGAFAKFDADDTAALRQMIETEKYKPLGGYTYDAEAGAVVFLHAGVDLPEGEWNDLLDELLQEFKDADTLEWDYGRFYSEYIEATDFVEYAGASPQTLERVADLVSDDLRPVYEYFSKSTAAGADDLSRLDDVVRGLRSYAEVLQRGNLGQKEIDEIAARWKEAGNVTRSAVQAWPAFEALWKPARRFVGKSKAAKRRLRQHIRQAGADMVEQALADAPEDLKRVVMEWYRTEAEHAVEILGLRIPELSQRGVTSLYHSLSAVLSTQATPFAEGVNAARAIEHYLQTGDLTRFFPGNVGSASQKGQEKALNQINEMLGTLRASGLGEDEARDRLADIMRSLTPRTQKRSEAAVRKLLADPEAELVPYAGPGERGIDARGREAMTPTANSILALGDGPKIGAYYMNLEGFRGEPVIDRWMARWYALVAGKSALVRKKIRRPQPDGSYKSLMSTVLAESPEDIKATHEEIQRAVLDVGEELKARGVFPNVEGPVGDQAQSAIWYAMKRGMAQHGYFSAYDTPATVAADVVRLNARAATAQARRDILRLSMEDAETRFGSVENLNMVADEVVANSGGGNIKILTKTERLAQIREAEAVQHKARLAQVNVIGQKIESPQDVADLIWPFRSPRAEHAGFAYLDENNRVVGWTVETSGAIDYVRYADDIHDVVLERAQRLGAKKVVAMHNHPSGVAQPSNADAQFGVGVFHRFWVEKAGIDVEVVVIDHEHMARIQYNLVDAPMGDAVEIVTSYADYDPPSGAVNWESQAPKIGGATSLYHPDVMDMLHSGQLAAGGDLGSRFDILYLDAHLRAVAYAPHNISSLESIGDWFEREAQNLGSNRALFIYDESSGLDMGYVKKILEGTGLAAEKGSYFEDVIEMGEGAVLQNAGALYPYQAVFDRPIGRKPSPAREDLLVAGHPIAHPSRVEEEGPKWLRGIQGIPDEQLELALPTEAGARAQHTLLSGVLTLRKAGLLTAPSTHIANITSNVAMLGLETVKDAPAALLDRLLLAHKTGTRAKGGMSFRTIKAGGQGAVHGISGAIPDVARAIQSGATKDVMSKYDMTSKVFFNNPVLDAYVGLVMGTLEAEDKVFRTAALLRSLAEQAEVMAPQLGRSVEDLFNRPTVEMGLIAAKDAELAVFQNEGFLSNFARAMRHGLEKESKLAGAAFDVIAPFTKTPANVVTRVMEYSPLGLLFAGAKYRKLAEAVKQGLPTRQLQREVADSFGRSTIGTSAILLGYLLASRGDMTSDYPADTRTRNLWKLTGRRENAIRLGDKWVGMDRISPFGNLLSLGAQMHKLATEPGASLGKIVLGGSFSLSRTVSDQSFLAGVSGFLDAINDPERNAVKFVEDQALGFLVPNIVRRTARVIDPMKRDPQNLVQRVEASVPGLSQNVPARIGAFGEPEQNQGGSGVAALFDPFGSTTSREGDPLIDEIVRVGASITPPTPPGAERGTPEYEELARRYGQASRKAVEQVIRGRDYRAASAEARRLVRRDPRFRGMDVDEVTLALQAQMIEQAARQARTAITNTRAQRGR